MKKPYDRASAEGTGTGQLVTGTHRPSIRPRAFSLLTREGFTLIEVLVSLALLTIVLGTVYSSFFSVQRALDRFDSVSLKYHEARSALDVMRREVESAFIMNPRPADEKQPSAGFIIRDRDIFGKDTSSLSLTSFTYRESGLNKISYFVSEDSGSLSLLKSESPAAALSKEYEIEIMEEIEGFTVETFFNGKWVRTWDTAQTGALPETVRISIEFDDNGTPVRLTEYAQPKFGVQM